MTLCSPRSPVAARGATLSRTVHLHVGVAKSGTTYLQRILHENRALLRDHGVLYPGRRRAAHFLASMDLRGTGFAGHEYPAADGAWGRLVSAVDDFDGVGLISHETLARSNRAAVRKAVESFATDDVRVVVTARDLARQVPSVWQETIKNRGDRTYGEFLDEVFRSPDGERRKGGFWLAQNLPALATRWMEVVGPERFTLVTVPPSGAAPDELWRRYCAAVGIPDADYRLEVEGSNPSLGVVESELLRRVNPKLGDLTWPEYETRIKRAFAERELATFSRSDRLVVPADLHDAVRRAGDDAISFFADAGCRVVGDLEDLRPQLSDAPSRTPEEVSDQDLLDLALGLVARSASRPAVPRPAGGTDRSVLDGAVAVRVREVVRRGTRRAAGRVREVVRRRRDG